jgi:hypothetical protein
MKFPQLSQGNWLCFGRLLLWKFPDGGKQVNRKAVSPMLDAGTSIDLDFNGYGLCCPQGCLGKGRANEVLRKKIVNFVAFLDALGLVR